MKRSSHLRGFATLAIATTALAMAGCASATEPSNSDGEHTLRWALSSSPRSLFAPHAAHNDASIVLSLVHEKLLRYDVDGKLVPGLAASWEATDPQTYVFTLNEEATFSNGEPVTADDVAFSLSQHQDPAVASESANAFVNVESIEKTADHEVTVRLSKPDSTVPYLMAGDVGYIVDKESYEADPEAYGTPAGLPVGSGPYMVENFVPDSSVTLVRNPEYAGDEQGPDKISFKVLADAQARMLAMRTGDIDGTFGVPLANVSNWEDLDGVELESVNSMGFKSITVDMEQAPFDDVHVRRAIAHAIDREGLVSAILGGYGVPASSYVPAEMFAGLLPEDEITAFYESLPAYEFDMKAAKAELAKSSVPDGFSAVMPVPADSDELVSIAQVLKESLAELNIDLELKLMEGGPRIEQLLAHGPDLGFQMMGYAPSVPDPAAYPQFFMMSEAAVEGGANSSNYKNPAFDALIDSSIAEIEPEVRAHSVMEALTMAAEDVAVMPIYWLDSVVATNSSKISYDTFTWSYALENWAAQISVK